jgi:hypothetical protein
VDFHDPEQWRDLLQVDPTASSVEELRQFASKAIRKTCNQLNRRADRRGVRNDLDRLGELGHLLEQHAWLGGK